VESLIINNLEHIRLTKGFKYQKDFAKYLKINKVRYNKIENNNANLSIEDLLKISVALEISLGDIEKIIYTDKTKISLYMKNKMLNLRLSSGFKSQKDFAEHSGLDKGRYNKIENNIAKLNIEELLKISNALNIHLGDIDKIVYLDTDNED